MSYLWRLVLVRWPGVVVALLGALGPGLGACRPGEPQAQKPAVQRDLTPKEVYEQVRDSVVKIETDKGAGTGFFVRDGRTVVTCFHVVEGASTLSVRLSDGVTQFSADSVVFDRVADVAVLQLAADSGRKPIRCGLAMSLSVGDAAYVIGNPLGFLSDSLSCGIVSGQREAGDVHFIQTSAAVSPGSSGSPLLNGQGQAVGVVKGTFEKGQALNIAVAIQHAKALLDKDVQPLSSLKVAETKKPEPTEEEKRAVEEAECVHGSQLMADYWGGIAQAVMEWDGELNRVWKAYLRDSAAYSSALIAYTRDRKGAMPDWRDYYGADDGAFRDQFTRSDAVRAAAQLPEGVVEFLGSRKEYAEIPQPLRDAAEATRKLANGRALASSKVLIEFEHATGDSSMFAALQKTELDTCHRFREAYVSVKEWMEQQAWFRSDAFFERLSAPVVAVHYSPGLAGVFPDPLLKAGCFVGELTSDAGKMKTGDRITGIRLASADTFEEVGTWRDLRSKLLSYGKGSGKVCVRVVRDGEERTETLSVAWMPYAFGRSAR